MTKPTKWHVRPAKDSDQPGHPPSLIRVFAVRMKKTWVLSYLLSGQRRRLSVWADAQADLSLRGCTGHFVGFVMRRLKCQGRSFRSFLSKGLMCSVFFFFCFLYTYIGLIAYDCFIQLHTCTCTLNCENWDDIRFFEDFGILVHTIKLKNLDTPKICCNHSENLTY